jgi:hypothetical protein
MFARGGGGLLDVNVEGSIPSRPIARLWFFGFGRSQPSETLERATGVRDNALALVELEGSPVDGRGFVESFGGPAGIALGLLIVPVYAMYVWIIWPVLARAAGRLLTRRSDWAKTAREPLGEGG